MRKQRISFRPIFVSIFFGGLFSVIIFFPLLALAAGGTGPVTTGLGATAAAAGIGGYKTSIPEIVGGIIRSGISLIGVIFLVLTVVSGFEWMTAGGNAETVGKARSRLVNSIIGMAIALSAYAISSFVLSQLLRAAGA